MIDRLHVIITLIAAIVIHIVNIIQQVSITNMCIRLILTIIIFYICGVIVRNSLKKIVDNGLYDDLEMYTSEPISSENGEAVEGAATDGTGNDGFEGLESIEPLTSVSDEIK